MTLVTNNDSEKKVRKSLADQIDRLDDLVKNLADNLHGAVAAAVESAVGTAVRETIQATLLELLTHPEIKALLQAATASFAVPSQAAPSYEEEERRPGLRERLATARAWARRKAWAAGTACQQTFGTVKAGLLGLWSLRTRLLATIGLGAAVGLGAYFAGPWLSALAGGVVGGAMSLFSRVRRWLQQNVFGSLFPNLTS